MDDIMISNRRHRLCSAWYQWLSDVVCNRFREFGHFASNVIVMGRYLASRHIQNRSLDLVS